MAAQRDVARRLSAILVADLVGYTEQMRTHEASTHARVKADLAGLFTPKIEAYRGRVVKLMGDGLLAEFASVVDCIECAREVQPAIAAGQSALPEHARFAYRIAVNVGDVIVEPDDIYGDGVNLAVRLQALGDPGGIIVSDDAYRQVRGKMDAVFEDLGEQMIKGVKEPLRIHRVVMDEARTGETAPAAPRVSLPGVSPIAVLVFENQTGDPARRYFSDGITNDIVTDLSKFSQLLVIASHLVFGGDNRTGNVQDVSRKLGVRYLVEGSVRGDADRVRINVQLIEGKSGRTLWAERYDRPIGEIFKLQDEIVRTIVATVVSRVSQSEDQRVLRDRPDSLEAYDAYLRGRAAFAVWAHGSNLQARDFFRRAIELDPTFSLAHGYLSFTLVQSWLGGWETAPEILARASMLARKAVELGPSEFDNYWSLAQAHLVNRDFESAMAAFGRAGDLNPNSPNLLVDLSEALVYVGRVEEAAANVRRAMQLNPMYPDWYLWTLGIALFHAGKHQEAVEALTKGNPPNLARRFLIASYARLGRMTEAKRAAAEFLTGEPGYTLAREDVWPYREAQMKQDLISALRLAGLPDDDVRSGQVNNTET
jgi:adenylate cyclase